jgi:hypothetical protein
MAIGASYAARGLNTAISPHRGSTTRSQKDLEELQRKLTSDEVSANVLSAISERCWRMRDRCSILRKSCEATMIIDEPEQEVDGWDEAETALTAAQQMPGGPERIDALKKAGLLRLKADERRTAIRNARKDSD